MPRDRFTRTSDETAPGSDDPAFDRVRLRGEAPDDEDEEDDDPVEWTLAAVSKRIRSEWPTLTLDERKRRLRGEIAAKFLKRFGKPWQNEWNVFVVQPPPAPAAWQRWGRYDMPPKPPGKPRKARALSARSSFVYMWDRVNIMNLPPRNAVVRKVPGVTWKSLFGEACPPGAEDKRTPDAVLRIGYGARFKTVLELVWISILGGNWPNKDRMGDPDAVLRAERTLIREALKRHGQQVDPKPWPGKRKIPRGPRKRGKK